MKYLLTLTLLTSTAYAVPTDYIAYCTDTNPRQEYVDNCVAYLVDALGGGDE